MEKVSSLKSTSKHFLEKKIVLFLQIPYNPYQAAVSEL